MFTSTSPDSSLPEFVISELLAALLVHLLWEDARDWDDRRQLPREEALALANHIAALLPERRREHLERRRALLERRRALLEQMREVA